VKKTLDILEKKKDELAREITEQMGRPIAYTGVEVLTAVKRGRYLTKVSGDMLSENGIVPGEKEKGFRNYQAHAGWSCLRHFPMERELYLMVASRRLRRF
jgi:acyl-CoA reductase-like NAD-dependent aldehyde dehydrogenase